MWTKARTMRLAVLVVALTTFAAPVAVAAAAPKHRQSSTQRVLKQIRALKKTNAALRTELTGLQLKAAELEDRGRVLDSTPTGPTGGDLAGTYPKPTIRPGTIFSSNLLDGTLLGGDFGGGSIQPSAIADQSIGSIAIGNGAVHRQHLNFTVAGRSFVETHVERSGPNVVGGNAAGGNEVVCPPGELLIGGGAEWDREVNIDNRLKNLAILASIPDPGNPNKWLVAGRNYSGEFRTLFAVALCLKAG